MYRCLIAGLLLMAAVQHAPAQPNTPQPTTLQPTTPQPAAPQPTTPQPATLDRVRAQGVLRCGAAIRPGMAYPAEDHSWHGVLVELCRAVAVAAIGPGARTEFNGYALPADFARARGADDLAFLTGSELFAQSLLGALQPGPIVAFDSTNVMAGPANPARHLPDLAGTMVCAEPGTPTERNLVAAMAARGIQFQLSGWQELEEMMDAFASGRCPAIAGPLTALAAIRLSEAGAKGRILPEALAVTPIMAQTVRNDPAWSAIAGWVLQGVVAGKDLPTDDLALGIAPGWQARVRAAVGTYPDIVRRSLGDGSALNLPPGLNQVWAEGGLIVPPIVE